MMTPIKDIKPGLKNINVVFIVLEIGSSTITKENREVRNYKVADPSACINVSIWDEPGKGILPGDIIKMTKGYASIWRHCLTLYSGKNGEVFKIGEFCMTFNEQLNMSEPKRAEQQQQQQSLPPSLSVGTGNASNYSNALQTTTAITTTSAGNNGNNTATVSNISRGVGGIQTNVTAPTVASGATKQQPQLTGVASGNLSSGGPTAINNNTASAVPAMEPIATVPVTLKARGTRASSIKMDRR